MPSAIDGRVSPAFYQVMVVGGLQGKLELGVSFKKKASVTITKWRLNQEDQINTVLRIIRELVREETKREEGLSAGIKTDPD